MAPALVAHRARSAGERVGHTNAQTSKSTVPASRAELCGAGACSGVCVCVCVWRAASAALGGRRLQAEGSPEQRPRPTVCEARVFVRRIPARDEPYRQMDHERTQEQQIRLEGLGVAPVKPFWLLDAALARVKGKREQAARRGRMDIPNAVVLDEKHEPFEQAEGAKVE